MLSVDIKTQPQPAGERKPTEMIVGRRHVRVAQVYDRWCGEGHRYVKFLGADGAIYVVRHDEASRTWEMTFFERRPRARDEIVSASVRSVPDQHARRPL